MSDIEAGLREAIEQARGRTGPPPNGPFEYDHDKRAPLTAPHVIAHIQELTKQAELLEGLAFELSDALAGGSDSPQAEPSSSGNTLSPSIFDRMGLELLKLTRVMESIERQVQRSLGAVKP